MLGCLLFWCKNRGGAILVAVAIGLAFVVKPALLPFVESGFQFPYSSATAMTYWGPGLLFLIGLTFLPESPRWLVLRGMRDKARASLERLRGSGKRVEPELDEIVRTAQAEAGQQQSYAALLAPTLRPAPIR